MLNEFQEKIHSLMVRLNTGDLHSKTHVCDEALKLISNEEDDTHACGIRELICLHLLDLDRYDDAMQCIKGLKLSDEYRYNLVGCSYEAEMFRRKGDLQRKLESESEGLQICVNHDYKEGIASGYFMKGKTLYMLQQYEEALEHFSQSIMYSTEIHDFNLIACAKYYIALCLDGLGHENIALEKLREASDDAWNQHSQGIIMHTEVARALMLMNRGDMEQAKEILTLWYNEFRCML